MPLLLAGSAGSQTKLAEEALAREALRQEKEALEKEFGEVGGAGAVLRCVPAASPPSGVRAARPVPFVRGPPALPASPRLFPPLAPSHASRRAEAAGGVQQAGHPDPRRAFTPPPKRSRCR